MVELVIGILCVNRCDRQRRATLDEMLRAKTPGAVRQDNEVNSLVTDL
jgi:hypothetical protein